MGFYITIYRLLNLCPETGKAFYYDENYNKIYDIPNVIVPEEFRRFLHEKNHIYQAYMRCEVYNDDAESVYEEFPDWERVLDQYPEAEKECNWTKTDHELFRHALKWFATQRPGYTIVWG